MNQTRLGRTPDRNLVRTWCPRAAVVSSAVAMTLALLPVSAVPAAGRSTAAIPDVTVLFGRAVKTVRNTQRPTYTNAVVLEADGVTRGGQCSTMGCSGGRGVKDASGVVSWRFVFDNQSSHSRFASATVAYGPAPKAFGKVNGNPSPFLEDVVIAKAPRMTLSRAVDPVAARRLQQAVLQRHAPRSAGAKGIEAALYLRLRKWRVRGGQHRDEQGCPVRVTARAR